ncbi:MAG: GIY-YIG nuclease family protein, partial [Candidatus Rokubacteria bacterium]|nr:GIY-YIG nuclease family protein [Candidatus Rokubacteria bacterium]MBI3824983.1 GIY-YIG nuclease family protein [Candidatus Rokubacteria bacterium]
MTTNFFYVYALKDPRSSPALPFYIGKGTGSRAYDHLVTPDATGKYARIKEILNAGTKPIVDILVDDLTEIQALRLEAELIAAFGTIASGGLLTNAIVPTGLSGKKRSGIIVPQGAVERAQLGLATFRRKNRLAVEARALRQQHDSGGLFTPAAQRGVYDGALARARAI